MDVRMRDLIAKASVVAEAPGADYIPSGHIQKGFRPPSGDSWGLADEFQRMFATAVTPTDVESLIERAELMLEQATKGLPKPDSLESEEERDYRILSEYEGRSAEFVAEREGVGVRFVWRVRKANGRRAGDGGRSGVDLVEWSNRFERASRARELRDQGFSARVIGERLGVHHQTVLNDLRDAA